MAGSFLPPTQPTGSCQELSKAFSCFRARASGLQYGQSLNPAAAVMVVPTYLGTMALGGVAGIPISSPYNSLLMSNLPTMGLQMTNSLPTEHTR